ncbi:MAG: NADH dehydrogenase subunit [Gammaproteobacteria bacterium]|nr:NADH dehydrogenase subunit [Gammaproteobacteria bacterium]MBL7000482.1 NADH dehydrogenase subunit [Gammaproteobacteria bacterium]
MSMLDTLLLISLLTVLLTGLGQRVTFIGWIATLLLTAQLLTLLLMGKLGYGGEIIDASFGFSILGQPLNWRYDALSWFFALITIGSALAGSAFAAGAWGDQYRKEGGNPGLLQFSIALNVLAMLLLLGSGDLLSLFIGWELVSWASLLLMVIAGGRASEFGMRYIVYATAGAMAVLAGLAIIFQLTGSFAYDDLAAVAPALNTLQIVTLTLLFFFGFGIKMGLLPFHLWQADAYAETPGPGTAFLGAISSRMGLYAILVVIIQLIGLVRLIEIEIPYSFLSLRDLLMWVAAISIIIPTFIALRQSDARRLLAWHGIGQGGYMLIGLLVLDPYGSAGGLMHVFNHATYQAALFLSVSAVIYRTRTSDLNRLGGLVTRMPLSFLVMLIGIIGLAGIPPMNGFVSKWLVYRSLIIEGMPLLFVASVIGTLGTILSVYKLIHNTFLGQLRLEHEHIREVPLSMTIPMLVLSAIVFITGFMPGLVLDWVGSAQVALGMPQLAHTLGGVESTQGSLDMIWVCSVLFGGFAVGALLFYSGNKAKRVHQLDNYAGGHFLTADVRYHYSDNFYAGLMHHIGSWYRGSFLWLESSLISVVSSLSGGAQLLYNSFHPALYLLMAITLSLYFFIG